MRGDPNSVREMGRNIQSMTMDKASAESGPLFMRRGGGGDGAAMRQNAKTGSLNECIEMARVSHRMSEFQDPSKELGHE